jgi:hypothetical protein
MPEALCGERVKKLATRATVLRARREELNQEMEQADITCASPEELATLRDRVNGAIAGGSPAVVKSLLQALIHEIRDSRHAIQPVFRVPLAGDVLAGDSVREPSRSVDLEPHNKNRLIAELALNPCNFEEEILPTAGR